MALSMLEDIPYINGSYLFTYLMDFWKGDHFYWEQDIR